MPRSTHRSLGAQQTPTKLSCLILPYVPGRGCVQAGRAQVFRVQEAGPAGHHKVLNLELSQLSPHGQGHDQALGTFIKGLWLV